MKKFTDPNEKIELANLFGGFPIGDEKAPRTVDKKGYVCRYCGKQAPKPHGGKCPYSPHPNKCHEFIKA